MEKIQDMVISVAEKEGWAVTIEEQNELRITFNFPNSHHKDRIFLSPLTLLTTTPMCFWRISLTITKTTTRITKPTCGLAKTDTDITVRHTT